MLLPSPASIASNAMADPVPEVNKKRAVLVTATLPTPAATMVSTSTASEITLAASATCVEKFDLNVAS